MRGRCGQRVSAVAFRGRSAVSVHQHGCTSLKYRRDGDRAIAGIAIVCHVRVSAQDHRRQCPEMTRRVLGPDPEDAGPRSRPVRVASKELGHLSDVTTGVAGGSAVQPRGVRRVGVSDLRRWLDVRHVLADRGQERVRTGFEDGFSREARGRLLGAGQREADEAGERGDQHHQNDDDRRQA